jgi:two-component system response regulator PilR (NtrC family)
VARGAFREDLFYRLNVIRIILPPLRERREDIPLLIEHFYRNITGREGVEIAESALRSLLDYHWPGNVRELENVVERCLVLGQSNQIAASGLPPQFHSPRVAEQGNLAEIPDTGLDLDAYLGGIEKEILLKALAKTGGVRKRAAELLGLTFRSIRYRLAKFEIDPDGEEE